jgi:ribonuclease P protein component
MTSAARTHLPPPSREQFRFPKSSRLLKRSDFVNLKSSRERFSTPHLIIVFKENNLGRERLGIAVGGKTCKAVGRNRIKRLLREVFRLHRPMFPKGNDALIIAKKDCSRLSLGEIEREILNSIIRWSDKRCAT